MSNLVCPSREQLADYSLGKLPEASLERVCDHAATCPACQAVLDTLDEVGDPLTCAVQRIADTDLDERDEELDRLVTLLEADGAATSKSNHRHVPSQQPVSSAAAEETELGRLGQYRLLEQLGHGGMGTVYKAFQPKLKRLVAIKVLPVSRMTSPHAVSRFQREMEAVGRLDHPNIVRAYDAGEAKGRHFLVMELLVGIDLSRLLHSRDRLPIPDACEIIRQVALGLQHAYEHGLVHRDVKPSNVILISGGAVKLLDLGLARFDSEPIAAREPNVAESPVHAAPTAVTATGEAIGTADYIAPEQVSKTHAADIRADVYSLGCTLYTLLTGHPPFTGPEYSQAARKLAAHASEPVPPITQYRPEVPPPLVEILDRMLAKAPRDRFAVPRKVAEALKPWCRGHDLVSLLETVDHTAETRDPATQDDELLASTDRFKRPAETGPRAEGTAGRRVSRSGGGRMGLAPGPVGENVRKTARTRVPVPIFSQPRGVADSLRESEFALAERARHTFSQPRKVWLAVGTLVTMLAAGSVFWFSPWGLAPERDPPVGPSDPIPEGVSSERDPGLITRNREVLFEESLVGPGPELPPGWHTTRGQWKVEGGALAVRNQERYYHGFAFAPAANWWDYAVECDLRHDQAVAGIVFRRDDRGRFYALSLRHEETYQDDDWQSRIKEFPLAVFEQYEPFADPRMPGEEIYAGRTIAQVEYELSRREYHQVRVEVEGNTMSAFVDGEFVLRAVDDEDVIWSGSVGLLSADAAFKPGISLFRNLRVHSLGPSPLVAWEFNEGEGASVTDATGNGHRASLHGGVRWVDGRDGGAIRLDGIDGFVQVPDAPWQSGMRKLTIHALFQLHSLPAPRHYATGLVRKWGSGTATAETADDSFVLALRPSGRLEFRVQDGADLSRWAPTSEPLPLDKWIETIATYDGLRSTIYVRVDNGEWAKHEGYLLPSAIQDFPIRDTEEPIEIGCHPLHESYLDATIDWVRIFNDTFPPIPRR